MGRVVIACYRPKPGKERQLAELARTHISRLRAEGLVTNRAPILMQAQDGTIIEVFEWASREAIDQAHDNPAVQVMWAEYAEVCDFVPIGAVPEAGRMFSEFTPLDG